MAVSSFRAALQRVSSFMFQVSRKPDGRFKFQGCLAASFKFQASSFRFFRPVIELFLSEVMNLAMALLRLRLSL